MCEHCDKSSRQMKRMRDNEKWIVELYGHALLISYWYKDILGEMSEHTDIPINYCPMCGRKLTEGEA